VVAVVRAGERTATTDVREALAGLGYGPDEIRDATAELLDDGDASAMLRRALQRLASAR
jgi:Holliday junction DNA helicase RuvA